MQDLLSPLDSHNTFHCNTANIQPFTPFRLWQDLAIEWQDLATLWQTFAIKAWRQQWI